MNFEDLFVYDEGSPILSAGCTKKRKSVDVVKSNVTQTTPPPISPINKETEQYLLRYFKNVEKIGKDGIHLDKKTILKNKIQPTDIVLEVAVVNGDGAASNNFVSVSFKLICFKEIKELSKIYLPIDNGKKYPTLVDKKYMELSEFYEHKRKIMDQLL